MIASGSLRKFFGIFCEGQPIPSGLRASSGREFTMVMKYTREDTEHQPLEYVLALGLRGGVGFIFGVLFGTAGLVFTFWVIPGYYTLPMWLLVLATGTASSIAGGLAFLKPETTWGVVSTGFALALIGGMIGAWIGHSYAQMAYPESVRNMLLVSRSVRSPATMPYVTFASLFSTGTGAAYYGFRAWRYHEV